MTGIITELIHEENGGVEQSPTPSDLICPEHLI